MKTTPILVAAYLRMSSDKQDKSIVDQRTEITSYAAKHGYKIVAWYSDEAISGWKNKERHSFHQLIADAAGGTFQGVLCWDQARFSRFDPMEANYFWHILRTAGVFLETIKEGRIDWNSLGGWLTASVQQHGKAEYVKSLAQDCTRGRRAAAIAGRWLTFAPYGYRRENDKLTPGDPAEVATVQRIFEMRAQGMGRPSICTILNQEKIPSPRGKLWLAKQVRMILLNEAYRGNQVVGRWARGKFCRITDKVFTNKGTHPAIIDAELWDRVQRVNHRRANSHASRSGTKPGGPLSGLIVCKKCKATMFYEKRFDRYICATHSTGQGCTNNSIRNSVAIRLVANKIRDYVLMGSKDALAKHIASMRGTRKQTAAPDPTKQLAEIDRKITSAAERLLDVDRESVPAVQEALRKLQARRDVLAAQVKSNKVERSVRSAEAIAAQIWELDTVLRNGDLQTVRAALSQVISRVELRFEQSKVDKRKWFPIGGTVFFFNYGPLINHVKRDPRNRSQDHAEFTRADALQRIEHHIGRTSLRLHLGVVHQVLPTHAGQCDMRQAQPCQTHHRRIDLVQVLGNVRARRGPVGIQNVAGSEHVELVLVPIRNTKVDLQHAARKAMPQLIPIFVIGISAAQHGCGLKLDQVGEPLGEISFLPRDIRLAAGIKIVARSTDGPAVQQIFVQQCDRFGRARKGAADRFYPLRLLPAGSLSRIARSRRESTAGNQVIRKIAPRLLQLVAAAEVPAKQPLQRRARQVQLIHSFDNRLRRENLRNGKTHGDNSENKGLGTRDSTLWKYQTPLGQEKQRSLRLLPVPSPWSPAPAFTTWLTTRWPSYRRDW